MPVTTNILQTIKQTAEETIWPTRCVICDTEGNLLCRECVGKIKFIDINSACPICGEPYGHLQCCGCSPVHANLPEDKRDEYRMEFDSCASVCILDENSGRIATIYKDAGERRLADVMAYFIANYAKELLRTTNLQSNMHENSQSYTLVTYIPSTENAIIRRGFDHGKFLAQCVAKRMHLPSVGLLSTPQTLDQRQLGRQSRSKNMEGMFNVEIQEENARIWLHNNLQYCNILLVDDVTTTGATLNSAAKTFHKAGFKTVNCITFARTF